MTSFPANHEAPPWGAQMLEALATGHNADGTNKNVVPVTNVVDPAYGAEGNGITDNSGAFVNARDAAGVGGNIVVPAGTYILDGFTLNVAGQTWSLLPGAILKLKDSSSTGTAAQIWAEHVTFKGGEIDGNKANNASFTSSYTLLVRASHANIKDVYVHDAAGYGIGGVPLSTDAEMNNVEIGGCTVIDSVNAGIFFNYETPTVSSHGVRITNCYTDNSSIAAATVLGAGISIYGHTSTVANQPRGSVIANCYAKARTDAVTEIACFGMSQCNDVEIVGCHAEGGTFGYTHPGSSGISMNACTAFGSATYGIEMVGAGSVTGCSVDGNAVTACGIMVNSVSDVAVVGNIIRNLVSSATAAGISLTNSGTMPRRIVVASNKIHTTKKGITVSNDLKELTIQGNLIVGDTGGQTNRQGMDVIVSTNAATRWLISGNTFIDCDLFGMSLDFTGLTVSDVWARDNVFITCGASSAAGTFDSSCVIETTSGGKTLRDGFDIAIGGSTGSKIGQSGSKLSFYGVTPIARAVLATGASKTVDDVITALQNLGLVKQS